MLTKIDVNNLLNSYGYALQTTGHYKDCNILTYMNSLKGIVNFAVDENNNPLAFYMDSNIVFHNIKSEIDVIYAMDLYMDRNDNFMKFVYKIIFTYYDSCARIYVKDGLAERTVIRIELPDKTIVVTANYTNIIIQVKSLNDKDNPGERIKVVEAGSHQEVLDFINELY